MPSESERCGGGRVLKAPWGRNLTQSSGVPQKAPAQQQQPPPSLADIMAEQLHQAEVEEAFNSSGVLAVDDYNELPTALISSDSSIGVEMNIGDGDCSRDYELAIFLSKDPDCSGDIEMALKLQREFNREMELAVQFDDSRDSRGIASASLSSDPYHLCRGGQCGESSDEEEDEDDEELREYATNLLYERRERDFPPCGFIRNSEGMIITKHDREVCGRKNCGKAMQLPLNLHIGDVMGSTFSDRVFNDLRYCSKMEAKRHIRLKDKDEKATSTSSVDKNTRLILFKWLNSGEFDSVEGVIAAGKESVVLHATTGAEKTRRTKGSNEEEEEEEGNEAVGEEQVNEGHFSDRGGVHFAIKVYKTSLASFKNRSEYVKDDFRFKNPRRVMKIWAERESMNLQRLKRAGVPCPTVVRLKRHVLLMSMVGAGGHPAPRLSDVAWKSEQEVLMALNQVKKLVAQMFNVCRLVHGDLSEFNLLYSNGTVYVIDVAQAMDVSHPKSLVYLYRDIHNMLDFFARLGVPMESLPTEHAFYNEVSGIEFDKEKCLLTQVDGFERENRNANIRLDKARPADMELRLYTEEMKNCSGSGPDLSRPESPACLCE